MKERGRGLDLKRKTSASNETTEIRKITRSTSIETETIGIRTDTGTRMRTVIDVIGIGATMSETARRTIEIETEPKSPIRAVDANGRARMVAGVVRAAKKVFLFQRS